MSDRYPQQNSSNVNKNYLERQLEQELMGVSGGQRLNPGQTNGIASHQNPNSLYQNSSMLQNKLNSNNPHAFTPTHQQQRMQQRPQQPSHYNEMARIGAQNSFAPPNQGPPRQVQTINLEKQTANQVAIQKVAHMPELAAKNPLEEMNKLQKECSIDGIASQPVMKGPGEEAPCNTFDLPLAVSGSDPHSMSSVAQTLLLTNSSTCTPAQMHKPSYFSKSQYLADLA